MEPSQHKEGDGVVERDLRISNILKMIQGDEM